MIQCDCTEASLGAVQNVATIMEQQIYEPGLSVVYSGYCLSHSRIRLRIMGDESGDKKRVDAIEQLCYQIVLRVSWMKRKYGCN